MKVNVNWDLCDGNGVCAVEAPEVFDLGDDDELIVLQETFAPDLLPTVQAAERACPKRAITIDE